RLDDNPHLDRASYAASLSQLDPITRAQLLAGDWSVRQGGGLFRREWFRVVDAAPQCPLQIRFWDLAASEVKPGTDPDWTAGVLMGKSRDGVHYVLDVRRTRSTPQGVEQVVRQTAVADGRAVTVAMEQEPGSAGVALIDRYRCWVLPGFTFYGIRSSGNKTTR